MSSKCCWNCDLDEPSASMQSVRQNPLITFAFACATTLSHSPKTLGDRQERQQLEEVPRTSKASGEKSLCQAIDLRLLSTQNWEKRLLGLRTITWMRPKVIPFAQQPKRTNGKQYGQDDYAKHRPDTALVAMPKIGKDNETTRKRPNDNDASLPKQVKQFTSQPRQDTPAPTATSAFSTLYWCFSTGWRLKFGLEALSPDSSSASAAACSILHISFAKDAAPHLPGKIRMQIKQPLN
eukprot:5858967-Amphidinium_carterae.1